MPRRCLLALLMLVASFGAADPDETKGRGEPVGFVASALSREIIGPRQTLAEVADYTEAHVPRMPEVTSRAEWDEHAARMRSKALAGVIFRGEATGWKDARGKVEWLDTIEGGPGYRIRKVRYEAVPGLWIPALLYEPATLEGRVPVVLNVNGHDSKGKAADYKQVRCINQAKRGMLALNVEWLGMGQLRGDDFRHDLINHIDLCGSSGVAVHYLALTRALDVLLALDHADPSRVAVTGLSGGGWQTIFVSAFDTRVTLSAPVAGYSSFRTRARHLSDLGDSEQTPSDLATVTDYAPMTAMLAPRAALLTFNEHDNCCFAAPHALPPLVEAAGPIYKLYDRADALQTHVNFDPGTHNYLLDNRQAFYRMVGDHFFKDRPDYDAKEIPSDSEVKPARELDVELPSRNLSLHGLALDLSRRLPLDAVLPGDRDAALAWRDAHRRKLREVVRPLTFDVRAEMIASREEEGTRATWWRLKAVEWSVPVVEFVRGEPKGTTLLVADAGRKGVAREVETRLARHERVLAVDPFLIGEAKVAEKEYLFALMLAAVGDRPLGLQASQIAAVARWSRTELKTAPLTLVAVGPRTSTMALVAAALEDSAIDRVEVVNPLGSLKELIETKAPYAKTPELFGFGLLHDFDVLQLAALVAPRPLVIVHPGDRATKEFDDLARWYATWGVEIDPRR